MGVTLPLDFLESGSELTRSSLSVAEEQGKMADAELELPTESFETAAARAKSLTTTTMENDELAELYGLFNQGSFGDVNIEAPGFMDIEGKAKWNAWNAKKGMERKNAMLQYIEFVEKMAFKYGIIE